MTKPRNNLGDFQQLVLLALLRLRDNAYGMTVRRELAERTGRQVSLGAVYTTLDRLEARGYVSSWIGEATPERGNRRKKYFRVEAAGEAALRQSQQVTARMLDGLQPVGGAL